MAADLVKTARLSKFSREHCQADEETHVPIPSDATSFFSNFYMDGEAAFMDGDPLDHNPYVMGDEAAEAWRAGWLAASRAATIMAAGLPFGPAGEADRTATGTL